MNFLMLLLLIAFGGSCGGLASAIAQPDAGQPYKIRVPFRSNKVVSLGCLGNILTGSAASIAIFFIAGPLFNLEPNFLKQENTSNPAIVTEQQKDKEKSSSQQPLKEELFAPFKKDPVLFLKLFSLSVAAGFAGIPLMEKLADQVLQRVDQSEEKGEEKKDKEVKVVADVTNQKPDGEITTMKLQGVEKTESEKSYSKSQTTDNQGSDRSNSDNPELSLEVQQLKADFKEIIALLQKAKYLENDIRCDENGKFTIQPEASIFNSSKPS